ncbi:uncharacterized protein LOC124171567 [Ischnura elegans]|uniref:uncharacterized protein LOC124171567 n=1 Tax=Ischnura elegans TaxID=197161 RepID=UPI001ED88167|nr:uncharacterized protein LOC124171567 [Ischnura elegans]
MFDDCIFHLVDILHLEDRAKEMLRNANLNTQPDFDIHWENASELAHQGAVHGEFVTATETFQGPLHYETDFRIGCKNQGRNYIYQNCINQSCMDTDSTIPDMMPTHNQSVIDKSEKLVNSTVLSYGSCDENQGICSQFGISRRAEQTGMSSSDSHLYQDFSVGMNSHSSGGYYHYYNSNTSYPNNRY